MKIYITVDRAAPWAKDPSVSTRGHESQIRSGEIATEDDAAAWKAANCPEAGHRIDECDRSDNDRIQYCETGRDARGYFTETWTRIFYDETETAARAAVDGYQLLQATVDAMEQGRCPMNDRDGLCGKPADVRLESGSGTIATLCREHADQMLEWAIGYAEIDEDGKTEFERITGITQEEYEQ